MSISNGMSANETNFNNSFASKSADNVLAGKQDLQNADAASGSNVTNQQREHNGVASFTGRTLNGAKDQLPTWNDNSVGLSTDNLKDRADALTTYAKALSDNKVTGPGSATDNAAVRFDSTTGKVVQNSGVIIDDSNNVTGVNDLTATGTTQNIGTSNSVTAVNIATGTGANTVTIGGANTTTTFNGTVINNNVTNLNVTDKLITLNDGGGAASAGGSGIEFEENSSITGYVKVSSDRNSIEIKAPNTAGIASLTPGASSDTVLLAAEAQTITNKNYNGGTASALNNLRFSVPKATTSVLNTISGTEGRLYYSTDEQKYYGDNGSALMEIGGSGSGTGGINYITNINAEGGTTGWTTYNDQQTFTVTIASPAVFTVGGTSLMYVGMPISFSTTGALPTGLTENTIYYISAIPSGTTYRVSATLGGADVNTSGTQSGTHTDHPGVPLNGIGGTPDVTWTQSASSPLRGSYNFLFTKGAANYMGQGVYTNFTVGLADAGVVLSTMLNYAIGSGTYADGDLTIWLTDTDTDTKIQLSPYKILNHSLYADWFKGECQTLSTSTHYRICIHVSSPSTSAYTVKMDHITCGPQAQGKVYGSPITDWESFTPTGSWVSNTTYTGKYKRLGDSVHYKIRVTTSGAPTATNLSVNLPFTIDTSKVLGTTESETLFGRCTARDSGSQSYTGDVIYLSTTSVYATVNTASGTYAALALVSNTLPITFGANDFVELDFITPVLGFGSSAVMSSDADTRVVAARVYKNGTQAITSETKVTSWTVAKDSHGMWDSGNNRFNILVPGDYQLSLQQYVATSSAIYVLPAYKINGGSTVYLGNSSPTYTGDIRLSGTTVLPDLRAGDYIEIYHYSSGSTSTIQAGAGSTVTTLHKLSGPAQIAASEKIIARYTTNAGASIANNTETFLDFEDKTFDSHGAVSGAGSGVVTTTNTGWKFVAPTAGYYRVTAMILFTLSSAWVDNEPAWVTLYKNGSAYAYLLYNPYGATTNIYKPVGGSDVVSLIAGDRIEIAVTQQSGGALALHNDGLTNYVVIEKVNT